MLLSRESLTSAVLPTADVEMPEMGGTIRLRGLDAGTMMAHYAKIRGDGIEQRAEVLARLVVLSVVDENGERIFHDDEWGLVLAWPNAALQRAARAAMALNQPPTAEGEDDGNFRGGDDSSSA